MILLELFLTFFKIGLFTFGGGYAMLPLIQADVLAKGWMENARLVNFVAVSESTPGPFAINIATYIGSERGGELLGSVMGSEIAGSLAGAFFATLGVVLPSFIIILIVARFFEKFKSNKYVQYCMSGLKPAVIGLIGSAVISVGKTVFFPDGVMMSVFSDVKTYIALVIFGVMSVLAFKKVHPIIIICISAILGIAVGYFV